MVESDLVFDASMLANMLHPDKIAVSTILPWMNGTTVGLHATGRRVAGFHVGHRYRSCDTPRYKTVNLYSLSLKTWNSVAKRLSRYVSAGRLGAVFFNEDRWYEIDTLVDLDKAEKLFGRPRFIPQGLSAAN